MRDFPRHLAMLETEQGHKQPAFQRTAAGVSGLNKFYYDILRMILFPTGSIPWGLFCSSCPKTTKSWLKRPIWQPCLFGGGDQSEWLSTSWVQMLQTGTRSLIIFNPFSYFFVSKLVSVWQGRLMNRLPLIFRFGPVDLSTKPLEGSRPQVSCFALFLNLHKLYLIRRFNLPCYYSWGTGSGSLSREKDVKWLNHAWLFQDYYHVLLPYDHELNLYLFFDMCIFF